MKYLFFALTCFLSIHCHAEWRSPTEIAEDLASEDAFIRDRADGEFGGDGTFSIISAKNSKGESVVIRKAALYFQVSCTFSYFPRPRHHHWIVFLDENREFLTEFQFPDCRVFQWVPFTEPVFKAIKYFYVEERFGPLLGPTPLR